MTLVGKHRECEVYCSDAGQLLESVSDVDLVFMDPPFNQGEEYNHWNDNLSDEDYYGYLLHWLKAGSECLAKTGSLWLNLPDSWAADAVVGARQFGLKLENWCIWHYRFAVCQPNRFLKSKTHVLWFSKGMPKVNREAALVPSDRATIYNDPRIHDHDRGGMRMDLDVWGFEPYWGRVQGNNKERQPQHENQLPEKYLERIIGVCTDEIDLVVDPFAGSGTTVTVASAMNRRCITGDISPEYAASAFKRLKMGAVRVNKAKSR